MKPDDIRYAKNLRNEVNSLISKEDFKNKNDKFKDPNIRTSQQKWKLIKDITNMKNMNPPDKILENDDLIHGALNIANTMNRQ